MHRASLPVALGGLIMLSSAMPAAAAVFIDKLTARPMPAPAKGFPQEFELEITIRDRGVTRILGCDMTVDFGDGTAELHQHFMDGGARKAVVKHVYEAAGTYTIVARGRTAPGARACDGERRTEATVGGETSAAERSTPTEASPVTAGCPVGWSLVPGSQSGYRYKCRAERAAPKIECQGGTKYFEQDGTIGCQ